MTRTPARDRDRYWLCDDSCTTDCGICKGAGRPPAPALTAVLDELDEMRAKGHELPWGLLGGTHDCEVIGDLGHHVVSTHQPSDAALIVAAVNRLPELTAALRAVLAVSDELEREAGERQRRAERTPGSAPFAADRIRLFAGARHQRLAAAQLRAALASPAPAPQGEEGIVWAKHVGSCRVFYAERRCTCGATA